MSRHRRRKTRQGSRRMKRAHLLRLLADGLPFEVTHRALWITAPPEVAIRGIEGIRRWIPVQPKRGLGGRR